MPRRRPHCTIASVVRHARRSITGLHGPHGRRLPACVEAKRQLQARRQQTAARPVPPAPPTTEDNSLPETRKS
jgi:hypothetical protein